MIIRFTHLPRVLAGVAVLTAGFVLTGCSGVVKNLNSAQVNVPNVDVVNPFALDKQGAKVIVTNPTAKALLARDVGSPNVNVFTFPNQNPVGLADIKSAELSFTLAPKVTLEGTGLPSTFTLTTFTADGVVTDTDGNGSGSTVNLTQLTTSGPLHFTLQGDGSYTADGGTFQLAQQSKTTDQQLQTLLNIVTAGPTSNTATLTLNATSTDLPSGTIMHITFDTTKLTVSASGS